MIQYLLHQQLSYSCSRSHCDAVTVLLELCIASVGSRETRNYARYSCDLVSINLMESLKQHATDIKGGFCSGCEQKRVAGDNHLAEKDVQEHSHRVTCFGLLVSGVRRVI